MTDENKIPDDSSAPAMQPNETWCRAHDGETLELSFPSGRTFEVSVKRLAYPHTETDESDDTVQTLVSD